jgi:hypothetical protein
MFGCWPRPLQSNHLKLFGMPGWGGGGVISGPANNSVSSGFGSIVLMGLAILGVKSNKAIAIRASVVVGVSDQSDGFNYMHEYMIECGSRTVPDIVITDSQF